jgi:hypothetical protein
VVYQIAERFPFSDQKLLKKMLRMIASESEAPSSTGSEIIEQLKGKFKNQYQEMRAGINSDNKLL